ncbi:MAG: gliding motility protein GldN [Flavobacteriaceae bacterium]|jgi:gliding motility associated protien GldN|nr:gliding motility protein GldN [Flavobacteriaceae bacterium]
MKKTVLFLLILSFIGIKAQNAGAQDTKPADTAADADIDALIDAYAETDEEELQEPPNSFSILNAKTPSGFRKHRESRTLMVGDSLVSNKIVPLSYGYINDKDNLRSLVVWEVIDLNDKINQPIYHNQDGLVSQNKSLFQILYESIMNGEIKQVYNDEYFFTKLEPEAITQRVSDVRDNCADKRNELGRELTEEEARECTDVYSVKTENVKLIKIKGMWYIDRRDGQMKYRLLGIAAVGQDPTTIGRVGPDGMPLFSDDDALVDLFWVWYPDAREVLANNVVFNARNQSSDITFDDILNARRFSSIIYKSDNGLGTGTIKDYIPKDADEQLEESDRIKDKILQMENDMWNY